MADRGAPRSVFDISWRAIAKVLFAAALIWAWLRLWQLAMVLVISILIATAVDPIVRRLEARGLPRWLASNLCILVLAALVVALIAAGWSMLVSQGQLVTSRMTLVYEHFRTSFPLLADALPKRGQVGSASLREYGTAVVASLARVFILVTIGMILTVYLLIEWQRTIEWLIAFVPKSYRPRVRRTIAGVRPVVFGYVVGNVFTSIFAATFVLIVLSVLKVPAAVLLALLAGIFDFVPVLGFVLSGTPAVMMAATVSAGTAVIVLGLYVFYHFVENYYVAPKVYGAELRLSNLAVLLSFAVGAELGGVIGALLALPVAAAYPVVEKLWLEDVVEPDTVEKHRSLEQVNRPA